MDSLAVYPLKVGMCRSVISSSIGLGGSGSVSGLGSSKSLAMCGKISSGSVNGSSDESVVWSYRVGKTLRVLLLVRI